MFDLLENLKRKDKESIGILYERYGKKLYGYAITQWKTNEDDTWDIIYKTLYKVIDSIDNYSFEDENKFVGFLFKVFTNYLRNHLRDTKSKLIVSEELIDTINIPLTAKENDNESPIMRCLKKALEALEDWQRILILMKAQEFSYKDIANYVKRPEKQLKVYNFRLRNVVSKNTNLCLKNKTHEA